jgi:uncharacterized membrane protein
MDIALVIATWLHTVAFVIAWGYYGILGRMVVPALRRSLTGEQAAGTLLVIERRALPFVIGSVVVFAITGFFLMFGNDAYAGLGAIGSSWTALILAKHAVVVAVIGFGVAVDWFVREAAAAGTDGYRERSFGRASLCAELATAAGAVVALLTAAAQASA